MIPQDPVSVSVIAFLVVFAVGTAWMMVGRQALASAARPSAHAAAGARGGMLIGRGGMAGAGTGELGKRGRGRLVSGNGGFAKPAERRCTATEPAGMPEPAAVETRGQRSSGQIGGEAEAVPSGSEAFTSAAPGGSRIGRQGRQVSGPASPLSADEQWSRITQIVRADIESAERADSFHAAAYQQLDAVDYAIARLREEMESISASGRETTRRQEIFNRPATQSARSGFVPLLGAGNEDVPAQTPAGSSVVIPSRPDAPMGPEIASVRDSASGKPGSSKLARKRRGKAKQAKEKSIAA